MQQTGTLEFADRLLDTLSGGERQKVYVAAALAQDPSVLLLDEPTTFLDYRHQAEIRTLLARANRESGVTVVAVTHDVNTAALESDRIVALRDGAVVFCGTPGELMRPDVLRRIYDTPLLLVEHPAAAVPVIVPQGEPRALARGWGSETTHSTEDDGPHSLHPGANAPGSPLNAPGSPLNAPGSPLNAPGSPNDTPGVSEVHE
jgi:hypothetical protein